jgi:hypothetical protein
MEGEMLKLQIIFKGTTTATLPKFADQPDQKKRLAQQKHHVTYSANHWSTLETTKEYLKHIIKPYVEKHAKTADPHVILIIDCWNIHKSAEFREYVSVKYPNYHLIFVPANCTSIAQPCDVIVQRSYKHIIRDGFSKWLIAQVRASLAVNKDYEFAMNHVSSRRILKPLAVVLAMNAYEYLLTKGNIYIK